MGCVKTNPQKLHAHKREGEKGRDRIYEVMHYQQVNEASKSTITTATATKKQQQNATNFIEYVPLDWEYEYIGKLFGVVMHSCVKPVCFMYTCFISQYKTNGVALFATASLLWYCTSMYETDTKTGKS